MNEHHSKKELDEISNEQREKFRRFIPGQQKPKPTTRLLEKNLSPMVIRKFQSFGWPLFVAIICDQDLGELDDVVNGYVKQCDPKQLNNIQDLRNFCGNLSDVIVDNYNAINFGCVEGVAVIAYWDKCFCSSLYGDHMTHGQCRLELFTALNMMTNM